MADVEALNNNHLAGKEPPALRGGLPLLGHMVPFARNPFLFMKRVSDELGEIAQFKIFNQRMILLTGDEASTLFYRSSDEQLDQSAAYKLMTPIFGEGIVFDAPIDRKNQQLRMLMPALRGEAMRNHADKILIEIEDLSRQWGSEGEVDLVAAMKQLTINTASHCLLGREFRYELTDEFAAIYHDLEKGVNALAYSFPNLPLPSFRKRDKARQRLHELVRDIVRKREQQAEKPTDMFQMLIDTRYDDGSELSTDEITGILVAAIFAGHHTSSGTAAWVLLELLKHPHILRDVRQELDQLFGIDGEVNFQSLREIPKLENTLKEVLRLHPPLIVLMRQVAEDLQFKDYTIRKGDMVWASPPVTHRMQHLFDNPEVFDPDRYTQPRSQDKNLMAYQPFGGGKHKCSGNAFAMFQIKAIFAVLLRRYDFELVDPPHTYVDDYGEMIVQPKSPCRVRYRLRAGVQQRSVATTAEPAPGGGCPIHNALQNPSQTPASSPAPGRFRIKVDRQLCQGHAMCMGEAPELFQVDSSSTLHLVEETPLLRNLEQAQRAVAHCPNQALSIETE
ncbi:cytochrome P450 [Ketobacter sp.]|uniref:cytochrome P450 n=1 Tax=Ketobacter sp. TaxID=2083498 RepID=UPI000F1A8FF7|nr:cytochrome P450 [Ketobacter sp.]RLT93065.1 MAG: cytochrome P450 [Ketobacter sp.]